MAFTCWLVGANFRFTSPLVSVCSPCLSLQVIEIFFNIDYYKIKHPCERNMQCHWVNNIPISIQTKIYVHDKVFLHKSFKNGGLRPDKIVHREPRAPWRSIPKDQSSAQVLKWSQFLGWMKSRFKVRVICQHIEGF